MDYETSFDRALSDAAHLAPDSGEFTVAQAHREFRRHKACRRTQCERKDLAMQTLREAGHLKEAGEYDRAKG